jgi:hypothetical protein
MEQKASSFIEADKRRHDASYEQESYVITRLLSTRHGIPHAAVSELYELYQSYIERSIRDYQVLQLGIFGDLVPYLERKEGYQIYYPCVYLKVRDDFITDMQARAWDDPGILDKYPKYKIEDLDRYMPEDTVGYRDTVKVISTRTGLLAGEIKETLDRIHKVWIEYLAKKGSIYMKFGRLIMQKRIALVEELGMMSRETIDFLAQVSLEPTFRFDSPERSACLPWRHNQRPKLVDASGRSIG